MNAVRKDGSTEGNEQSQIVQTPRIYTEEEIEFFLSGDRKAIDKLLLTSLNSIAAAFIEFRDSEFRPHVEEEKILQKAIGSPEDVKRRRIWLDLQIDKAQTCARVRAKIWEATLTRYVPVVLVAFIGAVATGLLEHAYDLWITWKNTTMSQPQQPNPPTPKGK